MRRGALNANVPVLTVPEANLHADNNVPKGESGGEVKLHANLPDGGGIRGRGENGGGYVCVITMRIKGLMRFCFFIIECKHSMDFMCLFPFIFYPKQL
jgi:hypothetical protein